MGKSKRTRETQSWNQTYGLAATTALMTRFVGHMTPSERTEKKKENGSIFQNENEQQKKLRKKNNGRHFFFLWKGLAKIIYKIIEHVPSVPQICLETGETEGGWDLPYLGLGAYEFIIEWQTSWQLSEFTLADPKAISL